jgi:hypothetical protein
LKASGRRQGDTGGKAVTVAPGMTAPVSSDSNASV